MWQLELYYFFTRSPKVYKTALTCSRPLTRRRD